MAFRFVIPGPLLEFSGNRREVELGGNAGSVRDALALLWAECPGVRDRVLNERGEVRQHVNVFVDGDNIRDVSGLETPVHARSEIVILPALSGG
jgi:molybdopterin synthase sulfur carrier subunit